MTDHRQAPPGRRGIRPVDVQLGMVVFGISNYALAHSLIFGDLHLFSPASGIVYLALVLGLSTLLYFVLRWRGLALGFALGFVVMTAVSGGAGTLFVDRVHGGAEVSGSAVYLLALAIGGFAVAMDAFVRELRAGR